MLAPLLPPPSRPVPRAYQTKAVDAAFQIWDREPASNLIIVAPTGSGKTLMIGMSGQRYLDGATHGRVLVLAHVPELVEQNYLTFRRMHPQMSSGIYAAKLGRKDRRSKITFALVQSVARNIEAFRDVGMIIIDEAHLVPHSADGQYKAVIEGIRAYRGIANVKILGLTATPWRLNSGNLLEPFKDAPPLFDRIAYEIDMLDLLEEGFLSRVVTRASKVKMDAKAAGVHKRGGEFIDSELNEQFNKDELNRTICEEIVEAGVEQDRKSWLVFAITVDHAERLAGILRAMGINAQMLCGETPTAQRRQMVADFKAGRIRALVSVNVLSTGFDYTGVDLVAMCRPTNSPGLYLQQAGRALRIHPGKENALLLDFAMNVFRHGLLTSVKGVHKAAKKDEEAQAPVKECPECHTIVEASASVCVGCGHEFPKREAVDREQKLHMRNVASRVMDDNAPWLQVLDADFRTTSPQVEGKQPVLVLSYQVEPQPGVKVRATETFCLDHPPYSWALKKGQADWLKRTNRYAPTSVAEAASRIAELPVPDLVRVVRSEDGRYWNVRGVKFNQQAT